MEFLKLKQDVTFVQLSYRVMCNCYWFKQYLFRIKYMGKYIQCRVRQDLTLSIKLLSKSFPDNCYSWLRVAYTLQNSKFKAFTRTCPSFLYSGDIMPQNPIK